MINAIIVDDEFRARRVLRNVIEQYCTNITIIDEAADVTEAVKAIQKYKPHLVFLDIEMPGYNGFQLLDFFDKIEFEIIFVTSYSEFALRAFKVSAIDYILKPIQIDDVKQAIEKAEKLITAHNNFEKFNVLKNNVAENKIKTIVISQPNERLIVSVTDIMYLKSEGSYVNFHLSNGKTIMLSKNIKDYEDALTIKEGFFRIHRSYLLNVSYVQNIFTTTNEIGLKNNEVLPISKERKQAFFEQFNNL